MTATDTDLPSRPADAEGTSPSTPSDFIRAIVTDDNATGKWGGKVATRFPPEPNGYPHIGHAKSICLNFGVARDFGGTCNLRFDDTNPTTEDMEYVRAIERDVRWLGFDWEEREFFASDYFEQLYQHAVHLVETGKAYVDSSSEEEIREYRGTITEPGKPSPYRQRSVEENLDLFARMRAGEFEDGSHVLRAKIDMAAKNMLMRDPIFYRIIRDAHHYRTGDAWKIYPMYDFTHCLSDSIEGITHSLCTLEFENNRELYDWVLDYTPVDCHPQQIEFARLNVSYTVVSKRMLIQLVQQGAVAGWDDPRMPTLSGLRRRGYTPESIRSFCDRIGVAKTHNVIDIAQLEYSIRNDLNRKVPRVLCVLKPLKVVIENYPEGRAEELEAPFYPHDVPKEGSRKLPFSRELYIERDDFREDPPAGFFRLAPGREVRLRYAYLVTCTGVVRDESGEAIELRCRYDPETRGGDAPDGRKVRGTLHWVSAEHSLSAEVRVYDRLFNHEDPGGQEEDFKTFLNPDSLEVLTGCRIEPEFAGTATHGTSAGTATDGTSAGSAGTATHGTSGGAGPGASFQFERQGYFAVDPDSTDGGLVFNRTVTLRDTWARIAGHGEHAQRSAAAAEKAAQKAAVKERQRQQSLAEAAACDRPLTAKQQVVYERYRTELALPEADARLIAQDSALGGFFAQALEVSGRPKTVAKWVVNELLRELKGRRIKDLAIDGTYLGELVSLVAAGTISGPVAKEVFAEMLDSGERPRDIVAHRGLEQLTESSDLAPLIDRMLEEHGDKVAQYRAGKTALIGFFIGQVMSASRGRANPQLVRELLDDRLGGPPEAG